MSENNTKNSFGMTSWDVDSSSNGYKSRENTKDLYLKLDQGSNVVRVLTKPYEYLCHQWKVNPADPGFGNRVNSSKFHGSDVLEEKHGSKPKKRWILYVIDRKTASVKLLDISRAIFDSIRELTRDEDWGDPVAFDIDIKVDKSGGPTGYYKVIPKSKKPLSPADLELKQNIDLDLLKQKSTPPTIAQMNARVEALIAKSPNGLPGSKSTDVKVVDSKPIEQLASSDDSSGSDDFDFPSVG